MLQTQQILPDNKPATINIQKDFHLIHCQYDKEYGDFFYDYECLAHERFYTRLHLLGGSIGEIMSLRSALINGVDLDKDKRKAAMTVATPEILEYLKEKRDNAMLLESTNVLEMVKHAFGGK